VPIRRGQQHPADRAQRVGYENIVLRCTHQ
jgi:hypothetical protein